VNNLFMESLSLGEALVPDSNIIHVMGSCRILLFEQFQVSVHGSLKDRWLGAESKMSLLLG